MGNSKQEKLDHIRELHSLKRQIENEIKKLNEEIDEIEDEEILSTFAN